MGNIRHYVDEGTDLGKVSDLRSQEIPARDIDWYVENDIGLGGVKWVENRRAMNPRRTKRLLTRLNQIDNADKRAIETITTKTINKEIGSGYRISKPVLEAAKAAVNYDSWEDARRNSGSENRSGQPKVNSAVPEKNLFAASTGWQDNGK